MTGFDPDLVILAPRFHNKSTNGLGHKQKSMEHKLSLYIEEFSENRF